MRCFFSVSYSVVFNGFQGDKFRPTRGFRQRDPLSPYLFILYAEGFSRLLNMAKGDRRIKGAWVGKSSLSVTHLFFADDNILSSDASVERANIMKSMVFEYEGVSG